MIQPVIQGLENSPQVGEIHDPAFPFTDRPGNMNFDTKGMTVQTGAFVALRYVRQAVSGLDLKYSENIHFQIVTAGGAQCNPRPNIELNRRKVII